MDKSKVAGILSIISGVFGFLGLGWMLFSILMFRTFIPSDELTSDVFTIIEIMYLAIGIFLVLLGTLGIVGGVFAIKKKRWAIALAGTIAAAITFFPCGIAAVILLSLARPEFANGDKGSQLQK